MTVWEPDQTAASLQILYAFLNCYEMDLVENIHSSSLRVWSAE